ncbi:MAG: helix-turn-helix transcriptional regulator, partial [Clostridia bacterium]|nr:helix-turn-helix transcriptional regulator [Clostridia bacterium]
MKDSFSEILKSFRTEKNLSQQQLADMLFVERTTIANWESG